jgi:hypothetical protein
MFLLPSQFCGSSGALTTSWPWLSTGRTLSLQPSFIGNSTVSGSTPALQALPDTGTKAKPWSTSLTHLELRDSISESESPKANKEPDPPLCAPGRRRRTWLGSFQISFHDTFLLCCQVGGAGGWKPETSERWACVSSCFKYRYW